MNALVSRTEAMEGNGGGEGERCSVLFVKTMLS